jgi:hypothetical protein
MLLFFCNYVVEGDMRMTVWVVDYDCGYCDGDDDGVDAHHENRDAVGDESVVGRKSDFLFHRTDSLGRSLHVS